MGISVLSAALLAVACVLSAFDPLHMLQLESYQLPGYFRWLRQNPGRAFARQCLPSLGAFAALALMRLLAQNGYSQLVASLAALLLSVLVYVQVKRLPAKKPLVVTKRAFRLLLVQLALGFALSLALLLPFVWPAAYLLPALSCLSLALSAVLAAPMERAVNNWYFRDAQRMLLAREGLIRVGITGSYGKTSTKFILGTILQEKYRVLVTPSSFNTPMGVTRVIREQLRPEHEVFVAEMGARHVGDIREMCQLVHPTLGLLTSVGPQHLETFGSIEKVAATKNELIECLPEDGQAYFAADGGWCEVLYAQCRKPKTLAGLKEGAPFCAKDISVSPSGTSFTLVTPQGEIPCVSPLLGKHNVQNVVLCAAAAQGLGLSLEQIASGIAKLEPVEHRLQLIHGAGGVTVIDDAFNANPEGARASMEVLSGFPGRRVVVTPGLVELGEEEAERNRALGRQIAAAADIALLVGKEKRVQPLFEGLEEAGFPKANAHRMENLDQATAFLAQNGRPGDVVLFENDLPDNY